MRRSFELSRLGGRVAVVALVAGSAAACSSDSSRLAGGNPFSNPFGGDAMSTGSVRAQPAPSVQRAPVTPAPIASAPLPPPDGTSASDQPPTPNFGQPAPAPTYASSAPPPRVSPPPVASGGRPSRGPGWTAQGGTVITVRDGESIATIAQRYGVPASAILSANGIDASKVRPGARITIPVYTAGDGSRAMPPKPPVKVAEAPRRPPQPAVKGGVHVVAPGETLSSIGRLYGIGRNTIADANGLDHDAQLKLGQRVVVPGGTAQMAKAPAAIVRPPLPPVPVKQAKAAPPPAAAEPAKAQSAEVAAFAPAAQPAAAEPVTPVKTVAKIDTAPAARSEPAVGFRWPVRGRVISGYGAKPNGTMNDGINLAVPEGTPVKAAESGTVAYVGNELKGFGNLVLVRHDDGWVTAYAHNSDVEVKKGDAVRRGQVIAKSGATGNVKGPQLHFEIRRGASPVDPMKHLPDA
jgi:murein DD-endopeptidase MepM/ murein hydrolase activator NlpD